MVSALAAGCALALLAAAPRAEAPDPAARAVGSALGKAGLPWYDARNDAVKPIAIPIDPEPRAASGGAMPALASARFGVGDLLPVAALVLALGVLVGLLAWSWRRYRPTPDDLGSGRASGPGSARLIEELPEALRGASDPWGEAIRLRDRGDLGGAIVRLFAHQLLTLARLDLVRLAPGRTGRQLVRSVADAEFRGLTTPTLRSFESVFYGHRTPSVAESDAVWANAEAFERRAATTAAGVAP